MKFFSLFIKNENWLKSGRKYRVVQNIHGHEKLKASVSEFKVGETLEYLDSEYSRYDGFTRYNFRVLEIENEYRWIKVMDDEKTPHWRKYFELL